MNIPYAGAEVYYKLRATAVRSSFHSNWTAVRPVFLMRMFNREAVEFSQVLEIEVSWYHNRIVPFVSLMKWNRRTHGQRR